MYIFSNHTNKQQLVFVFNIALTSFCYFNHNFAIDYQRIDSFSCNKKYVYIYLSLIRNKHAKIDSI